MPLKVNLRHLARHNVHLHGELPVAELDLGLQDEVVQARQPLIHDLEVQLLDQNLLVQGQLELVLDCECVRCLKPFTYKVELADWACHLALEGEERVAVVDDSVDLTPHLREDILLAFPAHPVCKPDCAGLTGARSGSKKKSSSPKEAGSAAWAELDRLKFRS